MIKFFALFIILFSLNGFSQGKENQLNGKWQLDEIIDVMTGDVIQPSHATAEDFSYYISFNDGKMDYNLETNKCTNEYTIEASEKLTKIDITYFSSCTELCCDQEFSELLTYDKVTEYYIKMGETLVLLSKDRIFYLSRIEEE